MLEGGAPLAAFDAFYDDDVMMYANDTLFASGASEGRAKQEPFIQAAKSITGRIEDTKIDAENSICVFRNLTKFTDGNDKTNQIDGLCWQRWHGNLIVEERYYDGPHMRQLISDGLLHDPALLISKLQIEQDS